MMSLLQHKKSMLPDKQEHAYSITGTCFSVNRSMLFDPFKTLYLVFASRCSRNLSMKACTSGIWLSGNMQWGCPPTML